jgi:hypothetical protein
MSFDPKTLPLTVQTAFKQGPLAWALVVENCLHTGIEDPDKLADIVFFLHHPERNGRPLLSVETTLIKQWKGFRTLIMPRLASYHQQFYSSDLEGTDVGG